MNAFNVVADYHMPLEKIGAHRLRVLVLDEDLSFEINGMVVFPPSDKRPEWTVYTPTVGNARIIGFNTKETSQKSLLWPDIQAACITATKEYLRNEKIDASDDMSEYENLSDEEFKKKIKDDLGKIPF